MKNQDQTLDKLSTKIHTTESVTKLAEKWKAAKEIIVFTNGCFDLIHYGHIHYLAQAKDLGTKLVLGLNSDASIKRLKGNHRPINDEKTRLMVLAGFSFVDAIVVFSEDDPLNLIHAIVPNVLVKGGDWEPEKIIGASFVLASGGKVLNLPYIDGYSTTLIEKKIIQSNPPSL